MHTNWCVLIEISMEIGMLNFWLPLLVTALTKENYFRWQLSKQFIKWFPQFLIPNHNFSNNMKCKHSLGFNVISIRFVNQLFWLVQKCGMQNSEMGKPWGEQLKYYKTNFRDLILDSFTICIQSNKHTALETRTF